MRRSSVQANPWRAVGSVVAALIAVTGCGSQSGRIAEIPPLTGNDRVPLTDDPSPDALTLRAAAERERGQLARAERFVRWALAIEPEHAGALVAAARIAKDRHAAAKPADGQDALEAARRYYTMAAAMAPKVAEEIAEERAALLVVMARDELSGGRTEQAAALLDELEATTPGQVSAQRRALAGLYGEIAERWLERDLADPAQLAATRARALGADGELSDLRLLLCEVARSGSKAGQGDSQLGQYQARLQSEIGRDVERWLVVAQWARRSGRAAAASWAAGRAKEADAERAEVWAAIAEGELLRAREEDAVSAWKRAAELMKPNEGAALLADVAHRLRRGSRVTLHAIVAAAVARAPGSEGAVRAASLYASMAEGKDVATSHELLEVVVRAAPKSWQLLVVPLVLRSDRVGVPRVLAAAREAGLVDATAHAIEAAYPRPDDAAFDAAVAATPSMHVALELARLTKGDPARVTKLRALARPAIDAYLPAQEQRPDLAKARATLDAITNPFEKAFVRAHFEHESGTPAAAPALAEEAARLASPTDSYVAESYALQLALGGRNVQARLRAWLAVPADPSALAVVERMTVLKRAIEGVADQPELQVDAIAALLAEPGARSIIAFDALRSARQQLLGKLGRWFERDDDWIASIADTPRGDERTMLNDALPRLLVDAPERAMRLAARLNPEEIFRRDTLADMVKVAWSRGETYRARRIVERILTLPDGDGIGTARMQALGQDLLDAHELVLARRAFERLTELGDRSGKPFQGWVRALLRSGDVAGAEAIITRALETRQRRDWRPIEEMARVLVDEGQLRRGMDLIVEQLANSDKMEPALFNTVVDGFVRAGREAELWPFVQRFIATDGRGTQRLQVVAAQRLMEVGALEAAQAVLDEAVNVRRVDPQLQMLALSLAVLRGSNNVQGLAKKLLEDVGGAFDLWDKIINEVRNATLSEVAAALATQGIDRFAGPSRLALARGRVLVMAGNTEAGVQDFLDAVSRATNPKEVLEVVDPLLKGMRQFERLAQVHARALALTPGRADSTLLYARSLAAAGQVDEATQVFQRVASETDRAHGLVAEAWADAGYLGLAIDAWARVEPSSSDDADGMLSKVSAALAIRGEGERLDPFVRLYIQGQRGNAAPRLLPIGEAYRRVGRAAEAVRWLERADRETPSEETALALMRVKLDVDDREGALAAAERAVSRRLATVSPGRTGSTIVPILEPLANELTLFGGPALARDLMLRLMRTLGRSGAARLVAARAMLMDNDFGGAMEMLSGPFEPWRQTRELMPLLRDVVDELLARGHGQAAQGLLSRMLESGSERELLAGAMRVALRAGDPATAAEMAARMRVLNASNTWIVGDIYAAERAPGLSRRGFDAVVHVTNDTSMRHAVVGEVLVSGGNVAALDKVLARVPGVREDKVERAIFEGYAAAALPEVEAAGRSVDALLPALRRTPIDPALVNVAAVMASFVDEAKVKDMWRALRTANADESRWRREVGGMLANAQRSDAALLIYDGLLESDGGDGALALKVFDVALQADDDVRAQRWADKALGRIPEEAPVTLRLMFAERAATFGATELAAGLLADDPKASWRKARAQAYSAFAKRDAGAFRSAAEQLIKSAPDGAVVRAELAAHVVASRRADPTWADEVMHLIGPLLAKELPPVSALELAFVVSRDAAGQAHWDKLHRLYVGPHSDQHGDVLEYALVERGLADGPALQAVLGKSSWGLVRPIAAEVVRARVVARGQPLAPAVTRQLEAAITSAAPTDVRAVELEVGLAQLAGDARGAVQAAESAAARAPWSGPLALLLARTLAETKVDAARAARIVRAVMQRPRELELFDTEARFLVPQHAWQTWETLAIVQAANGDKTGARRSLERAMAATLEERPQARLRAMQRHLVGASARELMGCVVLRRAPWSAQCDAP